MGRYYTGTISGKFWFGIQESTDASNFKNPMIVPECYYMYYVCCCDVINMNEYYCKNCFSEYDLHFNSMSEDDKLEINSELLAYKSNYIKYDFDESDLDFINISLKNLESIMGDDLIKNLNLRIDGEDNSFEYIVDYSALDYIVDEAILKTVACWCLGKQIEKAILVCGYCNINCEL